MKKFNWKIAIATFFGFIGIMLALSMGGFLFAMAMINFHPVMLLTVVVLIGAAIMAYFAGSDPDAFK
jgi:succinate dehydrogenase/fumarate reductase flavoprotein subunit